MRLHGFPAILAGVLFAFSSIATQGQTTSVLKGTLTDPSGSAIAGATIVAQPIDSSAKPVQTKSDSSGKFLLRVAPGRYGVTISEESFSSAEENVSLAAGESRTLDVTLELQRLASTVVVTGTAEPELASMDASPVDVLTQKQIEQSGQVLLTPLLASLPGLSFSQLGPIGGTTTFFLDGGDSNYTKVLVDGAPINVSQPGFSVDFSNLSADDIEKIELVHGASSALYGTDAMAGVLQIFTHRGTTQTPQITVEGDGGMFDTGHSAGQISQEIGAFDYSGGLSYIGSNGQGMGDYFRDATATGNFGLKFSDTDTLRLSLRNTSSDAGQPGQTDLASVPFAVDYGQHSDLHDFASSLMWNFKTGEHWEDSLTGYDSRTQDLAVSPAFDYSALNKFNRAGFNGQSTYLFNEGEVTAGYAFENETGGVFRRHDQAGYLEIRRQFGKRLTAIAGGRVEANDSYGTRAVPRVGASYALRYGHGFWGATRVRSSYGEGIMEPPLLPPDCTPILKPEQSTTVDAGVDQYLDSDRIRFSTTFFHNDFHDIVSFTSAGAENCPAFFGSYFNTDKARAAGSNTSFEVRATRWLDVGGNYSYDDSKVLKAPNASDPALVAGNRLYKRPLHSANLIADAHFRRMNWNLTGEYVGRRADSDFLGLGITSDPSYLIWNLANSIDLSHGLSTVATVDNLLNRHYEVAVGYPALRLNYRVGLKYTWGRE
ncbi:MAG TPA: TonB-dependent receptor plug domain-containing protein [Candidatus Acidoferrum sp.]|nr:TonB-dependent receptor plug domain-containing protein [Candidatus Acidoferrum sp.]